MQILKTILLTGILTLCGVIANAQCYEKFVLNGQFNYIGGGRVITPDHKILNKGYTLKVTPGIGYFVREDLTLGAIAGYEYMTDDRGWQHTFEIAPFLRYYITGGDFRVYVQWEGGYGWGKSTLEEGYGGKHNLWYTTLKPGLWIRARKNLIVEATLSSLTFKHVNSNDRKTKETYTTNQWRFNWLDIAFGAGLIFEF